MKLLTDGVMNFEAVKIVKSDNNIFGYDANENEIFSIKNISDFSKFTITNQDGSTTVFDGPQLSIADVQTQMFNLTTQLVNGGVL